MEIFVILLIMNTSHLLRLKVENFRSFYKEQDIVFGSLKAAQPVTAIYGPNAAGKSNIAYALQFIRDFIRNSTSASIIQIPYQPFLLKKNASQRPSAFEIEFVQRKRRFIYGFSATSIAVEREYLYEFASSVNKPLVIFDRVGNVLNLSAKKYGFGEKLIKGTLPSSLLITKARENNNEYANILFEWLTNLNILFGNNEETMSWSLNQLSRNPKLQEEVLSLLKKADMWIRSFNLEEAVFPLEIIQQLPFNEDVKQQLNSPERKSFSVKTVHAVRDEDQKIIEEQLLDLGSQESAGTQRFFQLAAPLIDTLSNGKVLYIDEFGSSLHADICYFIVSMFKSVQNLNKAQLIINTHDTSLMSKEGLLERENILFVEKNYAEESVISPLVKKSVRHTESFEKRYRQGLYGAKPQIDTGEND